MPLINDQEAAHAHVRAWQTALPSQVIDSFYQLDQPSDSKSPQLGRVVAFEVEHKDMEALAIADGRHLEIDYGFNQADLGTEESAFKMYLRSVGGSGKKGVSEYYSLKSLTAHDLKNDHKYKGIVNSLFAQNVQNNVATTNTTGEVPNEYISPTIEQWLFYAWRNCETAKLVDQVEAMYQDTRVRIKKSVFDPNVNKAEAKIQRSKKSKILTFVLLAIHQVIPGDMRIFPFGPILLSFIVPDLPKSKGKALSSANATQTIQPLSYELTIPCPPLC